MPFYRLHRVSDQDLGAAAGRTKEPPPPATMAGEEKLDRTRLRLISGEVHLAAHATDICRVDVGGAAWVQAAGPEFHEDAWGRQRQLRLRRRHAFKKRM
jgi:hypothetical protein